jgi:hypothetical protein
VKNIKNKKIEKSTDIITYSPPFGNGVCVSFIGVVKKKILTDSLSRTVDNFTVPTHTRSRQKNPGQMGVGPGPSPILFILTLPSLV